MKAVMVTQLQEATLTKAGAQKTVHEIRALQKLADSEEADKINLEQQLECTKVISVVQIHDACVSDHNQTPNAEISEHWKMTRHGSNLILHYTLGT